MSPAPGRERPRLSGTAALCLTLFCNTFCVGAFGPLLPEIARGAALADWEVGLMAGAFGLARMLGAMPAGAVAERHRGATLAVAPVLLVAGLGLMALAGSLPLLILGRVVMGLSHTLVMVAGLSALLVEQGPSGAGLRLNTFEFAGMLGILGGLAAVALVPAGWGWTVAFLVASSPVLVSVALIPRLRRFGRAPHGSGGTPPAPLARGVAAPGAPGGLVALMFAVGPLLALSWSSVSQFLIPLRGTREFGLDRAGVSRLLALAQVVDLVALLPVGRLADRLGRATVLGAVVLVLGAGTVGVGLGSYAWFVLGCACFGLGLAGWMLPLGVIREHTGAAGFAWRTGLYRVGVDGAVFLGPLVSGLLGDRAAGYFVSSVGVAAIAAGLRLLAGR